MPPSYACQKYVNSRFMLNSQKCDIYVISAYYSISCISYSFHHVTNIFTIKTILLRHWVNSRRKVFFFFDNYFPHSRFHFIILRNLHNSIGRFCIQEWNFDYNRCDENDANCEEHGRSLRKKKFTSKLESSAARVAELLLKASTRSRSSSDFYLV